MTKKAYCCFIPDESKLDQGCQNPAAYEIYMLDDPTPDSNTVSCAEHLEVMLDASHRFEIVRIAQEEPAAEKGLKVFIDGAEVPMLEGTGYAKVDMQAAPSTCEKCGGENYHHTIDCYLGRINYQIPMLAKFHCANCDDFKDVVFNQGDIICDTCSWIIATFQKVDHGRK